MDSQSTTEERKTPNLYHLTVEQRRAVILTWIKSHPQPVVTTCSEIARQLGWKGYDKSSYKLPAAVKKDIDWLVRSNQVKRLKKRPLTLKVCDAEERQPPDLYHLTVEQRRAAILTWLKSQPQPVVTTCSKIAQQLGWSRYDTVSYRWTTVVKKDIVWLVRSKQVKLLKTRPLTLEVCDPDEAIPIQAKRLNTKFQETASSESEQQPIARPETSNAPEAVGLSDSFERTHVQERAKKPIAAEVKGQNLGPMGSESATAERQTSEIYQLTVEERKVALLAWLKSQPQPVVATCPEIAQELGWRVYGQSSYRVSAVVKKVIDSLIRSKKVKRLKSRPMTLEVCDPDEVLSIRYRPLTLQQKRDSLYSWFQSQPQPVTMSYQEMARALNWSVVAVRRTITDLVDRGKIEKKISRNGRNGYWVRIPLSTVPLSYDDLSKRAHYVLARFGITNGQQLIAANLTPESLSTLRGTGAKPRDEICALIQHLRSPQAPLAEKVDTTSPSTGEEPQEGQVDTPVLKPSQEASIFLPLSGCEVSDEIWYTLQNIPVYQITWGVRAEKGIHCQGCRTLADVAKIPPTEWLNLWNFGQTSLAELQGKVIEVINSPQLFGMGLDNFDALVTPPIESLGELGHLILERLQEREQAVVKHYYGYVDAPQNLQQTGNAIGMTRERIRQIKEAVNAKINRGVEHHLVTTTLPNLLNDLIASHLVSKNGFCRVEKLRQTLSQQLGWGKAEQWVINWFDEAFGEDWICFGADHYEVIDIVCYLKSDSK